MAELGPSTTDAGLSSEALSAFRHPYVYAAHASFGNAHRADLETE
jgi:hypothetical protein